MCKAPKGETPYARYHDGGGIERFLLTADKLRDNYILYRCEGGKLTKLGRGKDPLALEKKYNVLQEVGIGVEL